MTAIIILAAGESSRLGVPKQNLSYKGETLLQLAIKNALAVSETVLVVLGANRENIEYSIKDQPVEILNNPLWTEGMASSIRMAIEKLQTDYLQVDSVLLMLCDQPFADEGLLKQLVDIASSSDKGIVASAYNDTLGVPVLFKAKYFPYLFALKGEEGAKKLLMQHADDVAEASFPQGAVDIDTMEDWEKLNK
jgi:molybdenum cofactor cytidylyltransferase